MDDPTGREDDGAQWKHDVVKKTERSASIILFSILYGNIRRQFFLISPHGANPKSPAMSEKTPPLPGTALVLSDNGSDQIVPSGTLCVWPPPMCSALVSPTTISLGKGCSLGPFLAVDDSQKSGR